MPNSDIPFVGVVPAIKPAAQLTKTGAIGLLATPATVKRPYTDKLIEDYAHGCEVLRIGSSELVKQAEELLAGHCVDESVLTAILAPFRQPLNGLSIDVVVMGCTHFPFLKKHLSKILPGINWVDSGEAIAKRVDHLLSEIVSQDQATTHRDLRHQIYFSRMIPNEEIFSVALKELGLLQYQLHCFSASMD